MIKINVLADEVLEAKRITSEFDKQKTYNKFECNHNYIGYLGELVLARYLTENNVPHTWVRFLKQGWTQPDFIIEGQSIDLKTSYSDGLWFQKPTHDVYIQARLTRDDKVLTITGCISKQLMELAQDTGLAHEVKTNGRTDYVYATSELYPIEVKDNKIMFKY